MNPNKKTILVFIDWYLPGYKAGGTIRFMSNFIDHLSKYFNFLIVTRNTDYCELEPYKNIYSDKWNNINDSCKIFYFSKKSLSIINIYKLIRSTNFDYAYINGIYSFYFSILPIILLRLLREKNNIIVSPRGMISKHSLSVKPFRKKIFYAITRAIALYKKLIFHATDNHEADFIKKIIKQPINIKIAPDPYALNTNRNWEQRHNDIDILKLVNISRIAVEKNTLFSIKILKKIVSVKIEYNIYGPIYDQKYWTECEKELNNLPPNITINYKGSIPTKDVRPAISKAHFFFLPTTGENFGHAILEALSEGCPIIISDKTPWQNLKEKGIGWDISLNVPEKFIEIIKSCASLSIEEYNKLSFNSYNYAQKIINDAEIIEANKNIFNPY